MLCGLGTGRVRLDERKGLKGCVLDTCARLAARSTQVGFGHKCMLSCEKRLYSVYAACDGIAPVRPMRLRAQIAVA